MSLYQNDGRPTVNFDPGEIAAADSAIDREVESRQVRSVFDRRPHGDSPLPEIAEAKEREARDRLLTALEARRFDFGRVPDPPPARFRLAGRTIATPGNIVAIQAGVKAGKTAVVGAILGAVVKGDFQGGDNLGFESENPDGRAVLHLDTEQSRFDADRVIRRALERADHHLPPPDWLMSFAIADLDIQDRRRALPLLMEQAAETCGGVHSVILDGVGDLLLSLNDEEGAFELVAELHRLAILHDCPIGTVLHENPGSETGKTRGHLGSQLERKAETNLRLVKDADGVTTIYTERSRHCHIPRDLGVCFEWSDEAGMHLSCGTARQRKMEAKRAAMVEESERVMEPGESMRFTDLVDAIKGGAGTRGPGREEPDQSVAERGHHRQT